VLFSQNVDFDIKDFFMTTIINFSKEGIIDQNKVKKAVYNRINFELSELLWVEIDNAFGDCWNNIIGLRGWVHEGQVERYIDNHLKTKRIIFDFWKVEIITKIIFDYISMTGGFLDE